MHSDLNHPVLRRQSKHTNKMRTSGKIRPLRELNSYLNANRSEKILWIISFVVAVSLCAMHIGITCKRYFDVPITTRVIVYKSNTFKVPSFVLCPMFLVRSDEDFEIDERLEGTDFEFMWNGVKYRLTLFTKMGTAVLNACARVVECNDENFSNFTLRKLNVSWDDMWLESRIGKTVLSPDYCEFAVDRDVCKRNLASGNSLKLNFSSRSTVFGGKCLKISQEDEFLFNSFSRGFKMSFGNSEQQSKVLTVNFYDNVPLALAFNSKYVELNSEVAISNIKKFHYLNTKTEPCLSTEEAVKCLEEKREESLKSLDLCYLPMLNSSSHSRNCTSFDESAGDILKYMGWLKSGSTRVMCVRSCVDTIINFNVLKSGSDNTSIQFNLENNIVEEYIDEYAYGSASFLSDLAGILGFFLGVSLIHIINKPLLVLANKFF